MIDNISDDAYQQTKVKLDDGSIVYVDLIYTPATQRWVMNVTWGTFSVLGVGLCVHPNLLNQHRNRIPFGIACASSDGADPFDVQDFTNGRIALYVLNEADVADVAATLLGAGS